MSRPTDRRLVGAPARRALAVLALGAGGFLAASAFTGCGGGSQMQMQGAQSVTPIKHIIFILKQNRSYDEYFGKFPNADGATTGVMSNGQTVTLGSTPDPMPNDIKHDPEEFALAFDGGRMDGFDREKGAFSASGENLAYSQMSESQIPNYWAYARTYALGDNTFASFKGSSFGNDVYQVAAQTGRFDASLGHRAIYSLPYSVTQSRLDAWGCDDPPDTLVTMIDPAGTKSSMFPCFDFQALPQILQTHGVSWKFYGALGDRDFLHNGLDAISKVRYNPNLWSNVKPFAQFLPDVQNGQLPDVSWVVGNRLEHAPYSACQGENESVDLVDAVMNSQYWSSTAIVIIWDEWGGFYDHVPPPQVDNIQYGFRVPLIVISPFTKVGPSSNGGYVDHTFYSHASLLKFAEDNWGLPSLTPDDAGSNDMMDFFDFNAATPRPKLILQEQNCPRLTPAQLAIARKENPD